MGDKPVGLFEIVTEFCKEEFPTLEVVLWSTPQWPITQIRINLDTNTPLVSIYPNTNDIYFRSKSHQWMWEFYRHPPYELDYLTKLKNKISAAIENVSLIEPGPRAGVRPENL